MLIFVENTIKNDFAKFKIILNQFKIISARFKTILNHGKVMFDREASVRCDRKWF